MTLASDLLWALVRDLDCDKSLTVACKVIISLDMFGGNTAALYELSCLAAEHNVYLAVNVGRNVVRGGEMKQFNTDVVFDRSGHITAVYDKGRVHLEKNVWKWPIFLTPSLRFCFIQKVNEPFPKRNLFMTEKKIFNTPQLEIVTFQTEFGKFGVMTCFDALYDHPFLDLVETQVWIFLKQVKRLKLLFQKIDTLIFLTAWQNVSPHFTSIGYHSGLARGTQINYLASNRWLIMRSMRPVHWHLHLQKLCPQESRRQWYLLINWSHH